MARHFIRSFVIAAALSPFVHAGPCRPSSSSVAVVSTTAETSTATGSATTHTKESSLTESLSGTSTETSVTISESGSSTGTSTETTLTTSKTESGSTTAEQSTTSGSALSTDVTTSASESDSSTGTTLAATTSTECPEPEPPVYDDPFTHTDTEAVPATTSEAATTTADANASIIPRNFIRRGQPVIARVVPILTTTTAEATSTSGEATTSGETTATSQDTTATTEAATTTTEEATTTAETTTASETACSYDNPFTNFGFEDGKLAPWVEDPNPDDYDPVYSKVVPGGQGGSSYHFQTGQFDADKSLWLYQDIKACPGATFTCSYEWWWNEYYAIPQHKGNPLVPYVRVYQGDTNVVGNQYPNNEGETKTWMPASFTFTMPDSGETRIWFVASSPQGEWINTSDDPCNPNWVHRSNWFALDLISCWLV